MVEHYKKIEYNSNLNLNHVFIHHHLGMGDHIICNGLIRSLLKKKSCEYIHVFAKENNSKNVSRMFDDDPRIEIISIPNNQTVNLQKEMSYVNEFIKKNKITNFMRCGFDDLGKFGNPKIFDQVFYLSANIPYENRWSEFKLRRDPIAEKKVLNKLNPTGDKYIFVHDDPNRGIEFNPKNPNNFKIIKNEPSENIFDMIMFLENAEEIHCMESSFRCLIDQLQDIICPLYFYTGVRPEGHGSKIFSGSKKKWIKV